MNTPNGERYREAVTKELVKQGVPDSLAREMAPIMLKIDWNELFLSRFELAERVGVAVSTISYRASRRDAAPVERPQIEKTGPDGRPSITLWLAPVGVLAHGEIEADM